MKHSLRLQSQGHAIYRSIWWRTAIALTVSTLAVYFSGHFVNPETHLFLDFLSLLSFLFGTLLLLIAFRHATPLTEISTEAKDIRSTSAHGIFSVLQSPKEIGLFFLLISVACLSGSKLIVALSTLFLIPVFERLVLHRESVLVKRYADRYADYVNRVPLFYPKLGLYRRPSSTQSWQYSFRSVTEMIFPVAVLLTATEGAMNFFELGIWPNDLGTHWKFFLAISMILLFLTRRRSTL